MMTTIPVFVNMLGQRSRKRRSRNRFDSIPDAVDTGIESRNRRIGSYSTELPFVGNGLSAIEENIIHNSCTSGPHDSIEEEVDEGGDGPEEMVAASEGTSSDEEYLGRSSAVVKIPNWRVLWGLLMTNGNRKITKAQYQSVRVLAETFTSNELGSWLSNLSPAESPACGTKHLSVLPHYSTLHSVFKPILETVLVPRASEFIEAVDLSKAGARAQSHSIDGDPRTNIRIILPSEFARADVSTCSTFESICSTSLNAMQAGGMHNTYAPCISSCDCVDLWPLVAAREWYYGPTRGASVDKSEFSVTSSSFCEAGDVLKVRLIGRAPISDELERCFGFSTELHDYVELQGIVIHVWNVHHTQRANCADYLCNMSELSHRDEKIVNCFSFSSYRSPSDSVLVEVPDLPTEEAEENQAQETPTVRRKSPEMVEAVKRRRAALKARRKEMEAAWKGWEKPLLKPSDVVVMLGPLSSCPSSNSPRPPRLFVVHRFWTEAEERSRHVCWVPPDTEVGTTTGDSSPYTVLCASINMRASELTREVLVVALARMHAGERGPRRYAPVSSIGTLDNGEKYVIYRFLLFWDAFELAVGKAASGEGFYLMCLNFPCRDRSSPSAVRIISLTPPGVKTDVVFKRIQEDILKGMTDGVLDIDATGQVRRIFLDLVGFIGDTPAVNSTLDVLGHTASACCHLCRFLRGSSTLVGSRYTTQCTNGSISAFGRTFYHHNAIRDCAPKKETCRVLGMKHVPVDAMLPIHALRTAMMESRDKIPTTRGGIPILSGYIDPYRACLIAPDHLLTGHSRDLINLAFKLLPSNYHVVTCEGFMIGMLRDIGLPKQNRLVDHQSRRLYSMSMTDTYALLLIAELGFLTGCSKADRAPQRASRLSSKARSAIALVGSFSTFVSSLWYLPCKDRDGKDAVMDFEQDFGNSHLREIQELAMSHIKEVQAQCTMLNSDVERMQDPQCDSATRSRLGKMHSDCLISLKTIDKPNVHRLQELVSFTLPMVGHVSRIGEMVLEKAHQGLKAAIRLSNRKEVQISAMKSIAISDWQGRLTAMAGDAINGETDALRGCFKLLAGRESVFELGGVLQQVHINEVRKALGPACCVPQELRNQGISVLSPRSSKLQQCSWKLGGNVEQMDFRNPASTANRRDALECILKAYPFDQQQQTLAIGCTVSSTLPGGLPGLHFMEGDVVEIPCLFPTELSSHFPVLLQPEYPPPSALRDLPLAPALWCITTFFTIKRFSGDSQFFATVLPCIRVTNASDDFISSRYERYKVRTGTDSRSFDFSIARLDSNMRKVGVLHCCGSECAVLPSKGIIEHCTGSKALEQGLFYAFGRRNGYPPRKG